MADRQPRFGYRPDPDGKDDRDFAVLHRAEMAVKAQEQLQRIKNLSQLGLNVAPTGLIGPSPVWHIELDQSEKDAIKTAIQFYFDAYEAECGCDGEEPPDEMKVMRSLLETLETLKPVSKTNDQKIIDAARAFVADIIMQPDVTEIDQHRLFKKLANAISGD